MPIYNLSERKIKHAAPGTYADGGGLTLRVSKNHQKRWSLRFTYNRVQHEMGLGSLRDLNLEQARAISGKYRAMAKEGIDPRIARAQERKKNRQAAENIKKHLATIPTFTAAAARHIRTHRHSWYNHKHAKQWIRTLKTYACPLIGHKPIHMITTQDIIAILKPIWLSKTETAKRVRARIENILDATFAVHGLHDAMNPARWHHHLDNILPKPGKIKTVKHHPAVPYAQVTPFMVRLATKRGTSALALQFLILNASRTSEVINATWDEIDLDQETWTIPKERMKNQLREHRVPLSRQAIDLLKALPRIKDNPYLFPGARKGRPISNMALLQLMRKMGHGTKGKKGHYVPHGFRSSFRDWASEVAHYPSEVAEMALAHTIKNQVEAAYRRGDLFDKRRGLMQAWANYLEQTQLDLALDKQQRLTPQQKKAMESIMLKLGSMTEAQVDRMWEKLQQEASPHRGGLDSR
ncbi:MAG: tyrosine-type recombinase/integrase [Candidatus Thiodiazotropha taylori]|nr:tyrosine-type recombinase/integrase [Candidatus Thiodiazotropha taylori]MCW4311015.1 tyrosine-type recombinase/integrase [Candidatus Thiodiazotropha endolucinida]